MNRDGRDKGLYIRMTQAELDNLRADAEQYSDVDSVADYVRRLILYARKFRPTLISEPEKR